MNISSDNTSPVSDSTVDEYELNDESIRFAECFSLNHYEVNIIRKYYKKLQKYTTGFCLIYRKFKTSSVNGLDFLDALNIKTSPFYTSLFRIYGINRNLILIENDSLNFNDFFQFVIFFSLNSTVALYYFILHALCSCASNVEWCHLVKLFKLIKRHQAICDEIKLIFQQHDLNNDGKVSINQFFNFLTVSFALFDPINYFRLSLIANVLTFERAKIILERRAEIININKYLESHNNVLPPEPCGVKLTRLLKGEPHPLKYDYDNRIDDVSFSLIIEMYIKKYDDEYVFRQETFAIKYLTAFKVNLFIREIDELFLKIRTNDPEVSRRKSLLTSSKSDLSKASETQTGAGRKKSILRPRRMSNNASASTRRVSASGQIYSLTSAQRQSHFPKGNSISSKNLVLSQSSIVPLV